MCRSSPCFPHDIVDSLPEALIFLMLDDCQSLLFLGILLRVLCILETFIQVLPPILLAVLPKIITLLDADFNSLKDIFDGDGETLKNSAPPGRLFQVAPVVNESSVIPKERPINLHPMNPESGFWGKGDAAGLDPPTLFLRIKHDLPALPVQLVEAPLEQALRCACSVQSS